MHIQIMYENSEEKDFLEQRKIASKIEAAINKLKLKQKATVSISKR